MDKLLPCLQNLVTTLLGLMPTIYQKETLEAIFGLFLQATGNDIPEHCQSKSPSAISRFLNQYHGSSPIQIYYKQLKALFINGYRN